MVKKAKVDYDEENDILWIYSGDKIRDSLEIDNFIIDFSYEDKIVGVEILDASEVLSNMSLVKLSKNDLLNILEAGLSTYQGKELSYVVIRLVLMKKDIRREIPIQIPTPKIALSAKI